MEKKKHVYVLDIQYLLSVLLVDALSRPYIILRTIISRNYLAATRLLKTQRERWMFGRVK